MEKFNAAFWKWFGDSKVVDDRGEPLVVYHGSPDVRGIFAEGFTSFSGAFFAAADYPTANSYADDRRAFDYQNSEPQVIPLYLSIKNPMIVDNKGKTWHGTRQHIAMAKNGGHDGLIIENTRDFYQGQKKIPSTTVFVWFDPSQAKTALDAPLTSRVDKKPIPKTGPNDGSWDENDVNIRSNPDRFWGAAGAGILFVCPADSTIMLALRSESVEQPGTWGITGGSCKGEEFFSDEDGEELDEHAAWDCAIRETEEELGYFPDQYIIAGHTVFRKGSFTYTTFIVEVSRPEKERMMNSIELNWENDEVDWFNPKKAKKLENLHFGVKFVLKEAKM